MESRLNIDSDRIEILEKKLKEANSLASEADRKFEEVSKSIKQKIGHQSIPLPLSTLSLNSNHFVINNNNHNHK